MNGNRMYLSESYGHHAPRSIYHPYNDIGSINICNKDIYTTCSIANDVIRESGNENELSEMKKQNEYHYHPLQIIAPSISPPLCLASVDSTPVHSDDEENDSNDRITINQNKTKRRTLSNRSSISNIKASKKAKVSIAPIGVTTASAVVPSSMTGRRSLQKLSKQRNNRMVKVDKNELMVKILEDSNPDDILGAMDLLLLGNMRFV